MSITYPLAMPTVGIESMSFAETAAVAAATSPFTFSQEVQVHQGQLLAVTITLAPMRRGDAEEWLAFFRQLNGMEGTFLLPAYHAGTARGIATGAPVVDGAAQLGRSLVTAGWTSGTSGILKAGDYFQLGSGATARLHVVMKDAASDNDGAATLDIWPRLRESPADASAIVVTNPKGLFRLASNVSNHNVNNALLYTGMTFTAREAF